MRGDIGDTNIVKECDLIHAGPVLHPGIGCRAQDPAVQSPLDIEVGVLNLARDDLVVPICKGPAVGSHQTVVRPALHIVHDVRSPGGAAEDHMIDHQPIARQTIIPTAPLTVLQQEELFVGTRNQIDLAALGDGLGISNHRICRQHRRCEPAHDHLL